jgi:hypothetical protein
VRRPTSRSSAGWGFLSLKKLGLATILIRSLPVDVAPRDILLPSHANRGHPPRKWRLKISQTADFFRFTKIESSPTPI